MIAIDLRSDTVTTPSGQMRQAMATAEVGDDVYGEDPTVRRLEQETAERLGKEAALFVPSGTMANQLGLLSQTQSGDEIWAHEACHMADGEQAGAAVLSRVQTRMFRGENGVLSPEEMRPWLRDPSDAHNPRQALITVENTMGYMAGSVYPQQRLDELRAFADSIGFRIHMDGARLWNAAVAAGLEPAAVARPADTVSVCFSKGLGAPVGSALAGSKETIARARRGRKLLGGGMRQAGVIAAGALYALNHHIERLHEDHERARRLGRFSRARPGSHSTNPLRPTWSWCGSSMTTRRRWPPPSTRRGLVVSPWTPGSSVLSFTSRSMTMTLSRPGRHPAGVGRWPGPVAHAMGKRP